MNSNNEKKIKARSETDEKFKWKISDMYESDAIWQAEYDKTIENLNKISVFNNSLNPKNLLECLRLKDSLSHITEKLYVYANLRANEDSTNTFYQGLSEKTDSLVALYGKAVSFIEPSILQMNEAELLSELEVNSELNVYSHYIKDILRSKAHILPPEQEEILASFYEIEQAPDNIYSMLNNADMQFEPITDEKGNVLPLTHGKYISFLESPNREIRKQAFYSYYKSYYKQKNTLAAIYSANVKKDVIVSKLRKYSSALEAALSTINVPVSVYKNLIETVSRHLPLMHKYISLRKKRLGVDELHMYDLYTPIVSNVNTRVLFDDAKKTVLKALEPLGSEYIKNLSEGLENGWIDVYENLGKRSGAYAWGCYGSHPYVSLNYDNTVNSMFTLAHEMGHALHSHYTWENQPFVYGDYTIFVAEVASTVNEALLMEYLLKTTKDTTQRQYLLNYFLEQFRGTLFRQTMFAEFELKTHEMCQNGEPLTFDSLCELYRSLNIKYYGSEIVIDKETDWEWARIPHFYSAFYVYQYATGYSAAIALSKRILNENGAEDYLKFLKGGSSDYSINLLKTAGVDMSSTKPVENAMLTFEKLLDDFSKTTGCL